MRSGPEPARKLRGNESPHPPYLLEPILELYEASRLLDEAVTAHLAGDRDRADRLIRAADFPVIAEWTESLWGPGGPWSRPRMVADPLPFLPAEHRSRQRMPGKAVLRQLVERDGFHCRFCGIPVIRAEVRQQIRAAYPEALRWRTRNVDQYAAFQALCLTYDSPPSSPARNAHALKGGLLEIIESESTLDAIGGQENLKAWIIPRGEAFT